METKRLTTDERLLGIVRSVTPDRELQEDLFQEAQIHLIQTYLRNQGQAQSWYMQSCRFHLLRVIRAGASVDAVKRKHNRCNVDDQLGAVEVKLNEGADPNPVFGAVSATDIVEALRAKLTPAQLSVLDLLIQGFGVLEVAQLKGISHQAVSAHWRSIAAAAQELGL